MVPDLDMRAADLDFRFVPKDLTDRGRHLIESYHGVHGYARLADLLWHPETREFIALHHELSPVLRKASITRSAKRSNQGYVLVAAMLLSLEILASDFAGWGGRHPLARRRADAILRAYLPHSRTRLMEFYFYQWHRSVDRTILGTISPAPAHGQGSVADHDRCLGVPASANGQRHPASRAGRHLGRTGDSDPGLRWQRH